MLSNKTEGTKGLIAIIGAMLAWGLFPIYWQLLIPINSWILILYRVFTVCVYSFLFAVRKYTLAEIFKPLKDRKVLLKFLLAGIIITLNWSVYIYAVNSNQVVQSAVGYYIEPLVICLVGNLLFREKFTKYNVTALILAALAVVLLLVHFRALPTIALVLAFSFSIYTAIKKTLDLPPILATVYETMFIAPLTLIAIIYLETHGMGAMSMATGTPQYLLMLLCGMVTLLPMVLYAYAIPRVSMFKLGMFSYLSPTIALIVGITLLGESLDMMQVFCFVIIWIGLVVFSYGEYKNSKETL